MQGYKCQICGKPATRHYLETIDGVPRETHYCNDCEKFSNANVNANIKVTVEPLEMLYGTSNILNCIFGTPTIKREIVCECGMTERELLGNCKFGCAKCYETFKNVTARLVNNLGGGEYVGDAPTYAKAQAQEKQPSVVKTAEKPKSEIDSLLQDLDVAIKEERYADCDRIKKKIDKLRQDKKKEG